MLKLLRKQRLSLWAGVAALLLCLCWFLVTLPDGVDRSRVWRVGTDNTLPYHAYLADGDGVPRPKGIAAELMDVAARRAGIRLKWEVMPVKNLSEGKVDLWPLISTAYVLPKMRVTRPIVRHAFVNLSRRPDWYRLIDKPKLATRAGPVGNAVRKKYPRSEIVLNLTRPESLLAVCEGRVDAMVVEARPLQALLLNRPKTCEEKQLHVDGESIPVHELGLGSSVEAAAVAKVLRDEIDRMIEDGSVRETIKEWSYYSSGDMDLIYREAVAHRATQVSSGLSVLLLLLLAAMSWLFVRAREAQSEAIAANQSKTQFLANVSHEIRTPLNGILGLAEVLEASNLDHKQRDLLSGIRGSGRNLLAIVNDVLDLARVTRGHFVLKPEVIELRPLFEDASQPFALAAAGKKLSFDLVGLDSLPSHVMADPVRMRQVFLNLLGNAVKFTEKGFVKVRVSCDGARKQLQLSVEDTGIGMSEPARARLFEKFYQADSSISRKFGGTGLGLAIVKEIVTAMGGSVEVESAEGVGSKFSVRLPVEVVDAPVVEVAAPPETSIPAARARVLVVEDNEVNQIVVKSFLEMAGHEVDCAGDGVQGVEAWKSKHYDVVLMDCQMPNLDGYEATARIRDCEGDQRHTPIVALTASAMPGERERCFEAGMDDFLAKPIQAAELQRVVDDWLKKEKQIPVRLQ